MYRPASKGPGNAFDLGQLFRKEEIEVWPENWQAWSVFRLMDTQWNVGMNGITGINYLVLRAEIDRLGLDADDAEHLFHDVRHMEYAALVAALD